MSKIKKLFTRRKKVCKTNNTIPLNDNMKDAYAQDEFGYNTSLAQNCFSIQEEQPPRCKEELTLQQLIELLEVQPDAVSSNSGQNNKHLIQRSVCQHFPEPPADLDQSLPQHLSNVQNAVLGELTRLGPGLEPMDLMGYVIECYHRQTCEHLHILLQNVSSSRSYFTLLDWGLKTYLSRDMLGNSAIQKPDPVKIIDLLLLTEWKTKAKEKLLKKVQEDVREYLEKILQMETEEEDGDSGDKYVRLYVDTISCLNSMCCRAQQISRKLADRVQEVCFQELLPFVKRYTNEKEVLLGKIAKLDEPETIHFSKALKMCKELKKYVQDSNSGNSLCGEIGNMLQNTEAFTLKFLRDNVANMAKRQLKGYFTTEIKLLPLLDAVNKYFPNQPDCQDVQETVMDEAYKVIVGVYVDHLINTNHSKLKKCWGGDEVGKIVTRDAKELHNTISGLAPGVQPWNLVLLRITEVLECNSNDGLKITVAAIQTENLLKSENPEFLYQLLQWKGLSKWEVKEVLDALPPDYQPKAPSGSWSSCVACV